jgi:sugar lactone lactonase YvrE
MRRRVLIFGVATSLAGLGVPWGGVPGFVVPVPAGANSTCASQVSVPWSSLVAAPPFSAPQGVAVDTAGDVYIADSTTKTLFRFDSTGTQTLAITVAGSPNAALPVAIAVDGAGNNIYTLDRANNKVYKFTAPAWAQTLFTSSAPPHPFSQGFGVATDAAGNVYTADAIAKRLYRFNSLGTLTLTILATAATPNLLEPEGIAVDSTGNIYTSDILSHTLYEFSSTGTQTLAIPSTAATPNFRTPQMIAVDATGNIYTADSNIFPPASRTLYEFTSTGTQTLSIPSTAASPNLVTPFGIAADTSGNIYATDNGTKTPATPNVKFYRFSPTTCVAQSITFTSSAPVSAVVGGPKYTVTATATSGLPVTFSIDASATSMCAITGALVRFIGAGTCVIDANQVGGGQYGPAPQVQQSFAVGKASQTITFLLSGSASAGDSFPLTATGGLSTSPVVFSVDASSGAGVCSVSGLNGATVNATAVGTCVIDANQAGDANYTAAPQVQQSFTVLQGAQTITFVGPGFGSVGDSPTLSATGGGSANPVVFTVDATSGLGVCNVSGLNGSTVTYTAVGTCVIDADQAGDANYTAAPQVQQSITVTKAIQTIAFGALVDRTLTQTPFTVSATASSGLPVTFSVTTISVCTSSGATGATISIVGAGLCTVNADQAGNATYGPAATVSQSFTVSKLNQTIRFRALRNRTLAQSPFTVRATASTDLPVTFTSTTPSVCTSSGANGATITLIAMGVCTIDADQAGNATYGPAPTVSRSFTVSKLHQTIRFNALRNRTLAQSPFMVTATASSDLTVTFSTTTPSVCTSSGAYGAMITLIRTGVCTINAHQAGNATYAPAPSRSRSFRVSLDPERGSLV